MRQISQKFVQALHTEVERVEGDWTAAQSELLQYASSKAYRRGLVLEFRRQRHHTPDSAELIRFLFEFARRRARVFRHCRN